MVRVGGDAPHIEPTWGSSYLKTRSQLISVLYFLCSSTNLHRWSTSPSWLSPQVSTALLKKNVNLGYYVHQALVYIKDLIYNGSSESKMVYAIKALGWYDRLNNDREVLWKKSFMCVCSQARKSPTNESTSPENVGYQEKSSNRVDLW